MPFTRTNWMNYSPPAINAANLLNMEDGIWYGLAHSGGIRNTAEFLDRNPASTTGGLAEAIADLAGGAGVVFAAPHNHPVGVNYTVPANVHFIVGRGATFTVANGVTLTINGTFEGDLSQHFSGAGVVVFAADAAVEYPTLWWGTGTAAFALAVAAIPTGSILRLAYSYSDQITSKITIDKRIIVRGYGNAVDVGDTNGTIIVKDSTLNDIGIEVLAIGVVLEDFTLDGEAGNGGDGIHIKRGRATLRNVTVFRQGQDGIRIGTESTDNCNAWQLKRIVTTHNGRHGVYVRSNPAGAPDANVGILDLLDTRNNGGDGLRVDRAWRNLFIGILAQVNTGYGLFATSLSTTNFFIGGDRENNILGQARNEGDHNIFIGMDDSTFVDAGTNTKRIGPIFSRLHHLTILNMLELLSSVKTQYRDADIYIHSAADGYLDLAADTAIRLSTPRLYVQETVGPNSTMTYLALADEASGNLDAAGGVKYGMFMICCTSEVTNCIALYNGAWTIVSDPDNVYRTADLDGFHCLLGGTIKNRRGASRSYGIHLLLGA